MKNYHYLKALSWRAKQNPSTWVVAPENEEFINWPKPSENRLKGYYFDDNNRLYRRKNNLLPNKEYIKSGYKYTTDSLGRINKVTGELYLNNNIRLSIKDSMDKIGKGHQFITDQRGHLIGDRFGGSNGLENIVPQSRKLNQGKYKILENQWASALKRGKKVSVDMNLIYKENSFRPNLFVIYYSINGKIFKNTFKNI